MLLAVLASVVLLLALLHSWPTRASTTADVRPRPARVTDKDLEERLSVPDHRLRNISFHVRESVARWEAPPTSRGATGAAGRRIDQPNPFVCLQPAGTEQLCM